MAYHRYLIITHHMHPSREHKTEMKDWGTKGKKNVKEYIEFSQKISSTNIVTATYIFDIKELKMAKNRYRNCDREESVVTDENIINYCLKEYHDEIIKMGWEEKDLEINSD